jgi:PAS domain S-box-containing protein
MSGPSNIDRKQGEIVVLPDELPDLRQRQHESEQMLENAGVGLYWLAHDGRILWANATELHRLGYSAPEYIGHSIAEFHPDHNTATDILGRLAAGEVLRNHQVRVRCKDGQLRHVLINSNVLLRKGEELYIQCFTHDVTDRVMAEAALRRSEERYRAFIHNSSEGIWCFELDHPINPAWHEDEQVRRAFEWAYLAECNDAMARMYGHDKAARLHGTRLSDLFVRSDPKNEAFLRAFVKSGYELRDAESHEQDRAGDDRYFRNSLIGVIESGMLVRVWGIQRDATGQHLMESALRESEERFSRFMKHLPGAAWIKNLHGQYVYANPEAERIFRHRLDDLKGKTDFDVFPQSTALEFTENDRRALQYPAGVQTIETLAHDDGPHESLVSKFPILDERNLPVFVGGVSIDITEQRRAQTALAESRDRLDLATRAAGIGTFDWEIPTGRVVWSEQEEALFGLSAGTFEGSIEHWAMRVLPEDLHVMQTRMAEAMERHTPEMRFAFRIQRADGACRWIEGAARFVYSSDRTPLRMVGVNIDVTDRREMEMALRAGEERLRLAAEAGNVGLWDWDILENRVVWSDRIYEFHGVQRGRFGGTVQDFTALIHEDDRERVGTALARALEEHEPYEIEFRTLRPVGQVRWLSTTARVLYDSQGKPVRMFGAVLDTTERRDYEERLRRSNDELEEFAFVASHDLREPMRMVNVYSDLLLRRAAGDKGPDPETCRQYIRKGVERMEELIHDLLAYSRVIHDDSQPGIIDLRRALDKAVRVLESQITEAGAEIVSDTLPVVAGDETQFEQVFQNLISNSLKYRDPGRQLRIRIRAAEDGQQMRISVADNGIGFDPKYREHIFGLFKRLQNEYPGTGLGLAICKRIVERYGGSIWAESTPGAGSTFTFAIPRGVSGDTAAPRE